MHISPTHRSSYLSPRSLGSGAPPRIQTKLSSVSAAISSYLLHTRNPSVESFEPTATSDLTAMSHSSVFYHYTSKDGLAGILATKTILSSSPHPATPGMLGGSNIQDGAVFLTRMDPANSKKAISYNNYRSLKSSFQTKP